MIITTIIALALVGLLLIALGIRGKRPASSAPHCRKCAFDLSGIAPPIESHVCPECGRDLSAQRAIRPEHRVKHRLPIGVGLALMVIAGAAVGVFFIAGSSLNAYKPTGMLAWEIRRGGAPAVNAVKELNQRYIDAAITSEQWGEVLAGVLDHAEPRAAAVEPDVLDMLAKGVHDGVLDQSQIDRLNPMLMHSTLIVRDRIHPGNTMDVTIKITPVNERYTDAGMGSNMTITPIEVDGREVYAHPFDTGGTFNWSIEGASTINSIVPASTLAGEGEHQLTITWQQRLTDRTFTPLSSIERTETATVRIIPPDEPIVELVADADMDARATNALSLDLFTITPTQTPPNSNAAIPLGGSGPFTYSFHVRTTGATPAAFAFRLYLISPEHVDEVASMVVPQIGSSASHSHGFAGDTSIERPTAMVLLPSIEQAEHHQGIDRIWDGAVIFRGLDQDPEAPIAAELLTPDERATIEARIQAQPDAEQD